MSRQLTWSRPPSEGACPSGRGGHSATQCGNLCIVFGGTFFDEGKFHYLNDVWALDVETLRWHKPSLTGGSKAPRPGPRYGHTSVLVDWKIYIFGGKGENGLLYNDLWCLDIENWSWELMPTTSTPPTPRLGHCCQAVDGKIVIYSGWDGIKTTFGDFWVYDRAMYTWSKPKMSGSIPPNRCGATLIYDESNARLVLYGGQGINESGHPVLMKDTRDLDLRTMMWSRPVITGDLPTERYYHASAVVGNVMVSFGGWIGPAAAEKENPSKTLKKEDKNKTLSEDAVKVAQQTLTATLAPNGTSVKETITIPFQPGMGFGDTAAPGATISVNVEKHPHTWLLGLDTMEYVQPPIAGKAPGIRYGATAVACGLQVLIFGGWEAGRALSELLVLDLRAIQSSQE